MQKQTTFNSFYKSFPLQTNWSSILTATREQTLRHLESSDWQHARSFLFPSDRLVSRGVAAEANHYLDLSPRSDPRDRRKEIWKWTSFFLESCWPELSFQVSAFSLVECFAFFRSQTQAKNLTLLFFFFGLFCALILDSVIAKKKGITFVRRQFCFCAPTMGFESCNDRWIKCRRPPCFKQSFNCSHAAGPSHKANSRRHNCANYKEN